jgi:lipopolysaccharide transport system permease protein
MDMLNVSDQDALSDRHKTVHRISAQRKIEGLGLDEIWTYRELIFGLLHRDFVAIKNQTSTAWFWRVLRPTFAIITYTILFEQIGKIDFGVGVPYFFMLSAAILPWNLFSAVVIGTTNSIPANAAFLGKIYFPRVILPIASVTDAVLDFILVAILLLALFFYMGMPLSWNLLIVPFFASWALILGLAAGLWLAALNVLYREIGQALGYLIQIGFFFSPITYPSEAIPASLRDLYHLNPLVGIIEGFRWAFLQKGEPPNFNDLIAFVATCLFALSGLWVFRRMERVLADVI